MKLLARFTANPHPAPPPGCTHGFRVDGVFEKTQRDRICLSCYEVDPCCQHGKEPRSRALTQWKQELRAQVTRTLWVLNASHFSPPRLSRASAEISKNPWTSQSIKGHLLQMVKDSETPAGSHLWKVSFLLGLANQPLAKAYAFQITVATFGEGCCLEGRSAQRRRAGVPQPDMLDLGPGSAAYCVALDK